MSERLWAPESSNRGAPGPGRHMGERAGAVSRDEAGGETAESRQDQHGGSRRKLQGGIGVQELQGGIGVQELHGGIGVQELQGGLGVQELHGGIGVQELQGFIGGLELQEGLGLQELQVGVGVQGGIGVLELQTGIRVQELQAGIGVQELQAGIGVQELQGGIGVLELQAGIGVQELQEGIGVQELQAGIGVQELQEGIGVQDLQAGIGVQELLGGREHHLEVADVLEQMIGRKSLEDQIESENLQETPGTPSMEPLGSQTLPGYNITLLLQQGMDRVQGLSAVPGSQHYAQLLTADSSTEVQHLENSIEEMLIRLDEFCAMMDIIRNESSQILEEKIPAIKLRVEEMNRIYSRVDKLEAFVKMVGHHVTFMEEEVTQAESESLSFPQTLNRIFRGASVPTFLRKTTSTKQRSYELPKLYRTEEYFPLNRV
ncbi:breast carcinoma-amplified sequence 4 isoform X1 [Pelobates cultripes]|uniref:Breast carcinoma-amplified sequence 4 isoform X1 n=2 Tax=Pelobates cultripes TaxID=61616 RepID=A0AAD1SP02_PELCU|nr:breast carcinoma-amplified sequence 4 isoform X1 [Pelobates cultripes]